MSRSSNHYYRLAAASLTTLTAAAGAGVAVASSEDKTTAKPNPTATSSFLSPPSSISSFFSGFTSPSAAKPCTNVDCMPRLSPKEPCLMTVKDIKRMVEDEERIVVSFMGGVYDVTEFTGHPGGYGRLEMVAGCDLEPFWKVYTQHNRGHILEVLQRYKIGWLSDEEAEEQRASTPEFDNPYANDPPTYPTLLTNTRHPYNAEGPLRKLTDDFITPVGLHYVRNHGLVPDIDPEEYTLTVTGVGCKEKVYKLSDLKNSRKFDHVDVTTVIQCNGNRREDFHFQKPGVPAFGPPHWVAGAIGCSTWRGVRLRDLLKASGFDSDGISLNKTPLPPGANNVSFKGYDHDEVGNNYCCSIPVEKALDPYGDTIVAFQMNGEDIPRSHGYPVRLIVPGNAGARNCKFLEKITVTPNPCLDAGNWKQYAVHAPDVPLFKLAEFEEHHVELKMDPVVQEMPVQSMITVPSAGDELKVEGTKDAPYVTLKGVAWGGGGSGISRVDVSVDGGETFTRADLLPKPEDVRARERRGAEWSWQFFERRVPLAGEALERVKKGEKAEIVLTSKALNTAWNVQPESPDTTFNPHGCCVNHWYKVPVTVDPALKESKRGEVGDFENKPTGGSFKSPFKNFEKPPKKAGAGQ
mmetsp:Transcript_9028/g.18069  ORF Transcript_9028/g.18069 Transcript_9028/m.18069 type:complete len:636 (-) Transcript_9028:82-1989(-)|eukprot:CAMPEP_0182465196 /NCGR_PEP_ID=MMETSP1319-20130603/9048_1 /TAXON_ID=172717 /ORGANISM="Bolidomonas pacifica, Strain RCC208" /LENGTH=635 /DNA_ID=CAMNT_0024664889 /DNA_START=33 /DNA_END=1940 /DNA_ORIENTATION=+